MANGIYTAAAGAVARQRLVDIVANNLANVGATGFRAQRLAFEQILAGAADAEARQTAAQNVSLDVRAGALNATGNPLDLALASDGFFVVRAESGPALVRSVSLRLTSDGRLLDQAGRAIQAGGADAVLDPDAAPTVNERGDVLQRGKVALRLDIAAAPDPSRLLPIGDGAYRPTPASGEPFSLEAEVVSGALEDSNVDSLTSMVELIGLQRDYQALMRTVASYKEADERLITDLGREQG